MCVGYVLVHVDEGQRSALSSWIAPYFLRQSVVEPGPSGFAETDSLMSPREPPAPNPSPLSAGVADVAFCFNTGDLNSDPDACVAVTLPTELFP